MLPELFWSYTVQFLSNSTKRKIIYFYLNYEYFVLHLPHSSIIHSFRLKIHVAVLTSFQGFT